MCLFVPLPAVDETLVPRFPSLSLKKLFVVVGVKPGECPAPSGVCVVLTLSPVSGQRSAAREGAPAPPAASLDNTTALPPNDVNDDFVVTLDGVAARDASTAEGAFYRDVRSSASSADAAAAPWQPLPGGGVPTRENTSPCVDNEAGSTGRGLSGRSVVISGGGGVGGGGAGSGNGFFYAGQLMVDFANGPLEYLPFPANTMVLSVGLTNLHARLALTNCSVVSSGCFARLSSCSSSVVLARPAVPTVVFCGSLEALLSG